MSDLFVLPRTERGRSLLKSCIRGVGWELFDGLKADDVDWDEEIQEADRIVEEFERQEAELDALGADGPGAAA